MAPLRVVEKFTDLTSNEVNDLFLAVQKVQGINEQVHNAHSSSIVIQDGQDAGQTVKVCTSMNFLLLIFFLNNYYSILLYN